MKNITVLVLSLALIISALAPAQGETVYPPMPGEAAVFEGSWQCDGTFAQVGWYEGAFAILVIRESKSGQTEWQYVCAYDSDSASLRSVSGVMNNVLYDENGEYVSTDTVYGDGAAVFTLDAEGRLIWQDEKDDAGKDLRFEKLENFEPPFKTVGEAMDSEGYTGLASSFENCFVIIVEADGSYLRVVTELDETAEKLGKAIAKAENMSAANGEYIAYLKTLPVTYFEEITLPPLSQEEIDALSGRTIAELEKEGFEAPFHRGSGSGDIIFFLVKDLYEYEFTVNESYEEYQLLCEDKVEPGIFTLKSGRLLGPSANMLDLNWQPDGSHYEYEDLGAGYFGSSSDFMDIFAEALRGGEIDPESLFSAMAEAFPENADEIQAYIEKFREMYSSGMALPEAGEAESDGGDTAVFGED